MTPVNPEILNALTTAISSEIASYVFYMEAARKQQAAEIKSILENLALEEKKHFQILESQHGSLIKSEQWISIADILKSDQLPQINEEMTASHRQIIEEVKQADSTAKILDIAYRMEQAARDMFRAEAEKSDSDEATTMFDKLAGFEQGHMQTIDKLRKSIT